MKNGPAGYSRSIQIMNTFCLAFLKMNKMNKVKKNEQSGMLIKE